jgi:hypothetical protein
MAKLAMQRKNQIGLCHSLKQSFPDEYVFFEAILKNHLWDACDGMIDVRIKKNIKYPTNDIIVVLETTEKIVSLNKCFYKNKEKAQEQDTRKRWIDACRVVIYPQIEEYRKRAEKVCVLCQSTEKLQVDHIKHFDEIWTTYYTTNPKPEIISLPTGENTVNDGFYEYHKKEATYRILCQTCNCTREKWVKSIL